nr:MAG TPA: Middle operon regulator, TRANSCRIPTION.2A [Caudoviricetes sp.]
MRVIGEQGGAGRRLPQERAFNMTEEDFADIRHLLPESVLCMIQVAGLEATFTLIKRYGGTHFPIGKNQTKAGKLLHAVLAEEVGEEVAANLGMAYAGQRSLWLPKCEGAILELRDRYIRRQFDEMTTRGQYRLSAVLATASLALAHNLTQRRIWHILKQTDKTPETAVQAALF